MSLYVDDSNDIDQQFLGSEGSLLGLKIAITLDSRQDFGMLFEFIILVASVVIHLMLLGPRFFRNSGRTPSVPSAFLFLTDFSVF